MTSVLWLDSLDTCPEAPREPHLLSHLKLGTSHLSYCTNIHPAETWEQTAQVLRTHVLAVRDRLRTNGLLDDADPFAVGLRLSAVAARELMVGERLDRFRDWLAETNTYVFTVNGFPYGSFHGTRVKEQVFKPDWSDPERLEYTKNLFRILDVIARPGTAASVSTLPGSFKSFQADESAIRRHLYELAAFLDDLSEKSGRDFHLGLEPEPLGHFENTAETLNFFERLHERAIDSEQLARRIGVNYDACHFALEYDEAERALDALCTAGIRISKIHLSSALAFDPGDRDALGAIHAFEEPTYFHQVLLRGISGIKRFKDLPDFFASMGAGETTADAWDEARVHFHIPLDAEPAAPLRSTRDQTLEVLAWRRQNPSRCEHYEIETYTWGVLPATLQRPVEEQIAGEYRWVLDHA